ncbi:MAG: lysophospholipid acyltransferase family protein [Rubricella sp.]
MKRRGIKRRLDRLGGWLANTILRTIHAALRLLPPDRRVALGGAVGRTLLVRVPFIRKRADRNLALIYPMMPPEERAAAIAACGDNFGRVAVEQGMMGTFIARTDRFRPTGPGWDIARAEIAAGRAVVFASAHYGNWEAIRALFKAEGLSVAGVYRPHNNPFFNADFVASLEEVDETTFAKGSGTKDLIRHVREGGAVMILIDQKQTGSPLFDFLGHPAETALTPAKLALTSDAPLIPALARRMEDGTHFEAWLGAPIAQGTPEEMTEAVNAALTEGIERAPEQWFWFHRRWR